LLSEGNIRRRNGHSFAGGIIASGIEVGRIHQAILVIHWRWQTIRTSRDTLWIVERLMRLDNHRMMRMGGKAEGADGRESGEARGLEGDDVDAVWGGLEVDKVERPGQGEGGRALAVDLGRGHHVVAGDGGLDHQGARGQGDRAGLHVLGRMYTGQVGNFIACHPFIPECGHHQLFSRGLSISGGADISSLALDRLLDGDGLLFCT